MQIIPLKTGDRLRMKKNHPCGGNVFRVLRVGSDVRVVCETCGRDMNVERVKLEKAIRQILSAESEDNDGKRGDVNDG